MWVTRRKMFPTGKRIQPITYRAPLVAINLQFILQILCWHLLLPAWTRGDIFSLFFSLSLSSTEFFLPVPFVSIVSCLPLIESARLCPPGLGAGYTFYLPVIAVPQKPIQLGPALFAILVTCIVPLIVDFWHHQIYHWIPLRTQRLQSHHLFLSQVKSFNIWIYTTKSLH